MAKTIVQIAKKSCPAVITIVVSKDLPKIEGYYMYPFGGRDYMMPKFDHTALNEKTQIGGGSGFVVSKDGYVLTSNHVVSDTTAEYTVIMGPKEKYPAKVLARDPINDVAILKVEAKNLGFLDLGDSKNLQIGEGVVAIGNALGEFHDTLSSGIISGLSRYITAVNGLSQQAENLRGLIQTDAAINPGNSGGPLVNMQGKVIGINTAVVAGAQNIGFAIPINYAKKDLVEVKKYGRIIIPFLGVKYVLISKEMAQANKLPVEYGALVIRETLGEPPVIINAPAHKAGIKEFDIILECHGQKITTENPLVNILSKKKVGEKVPLKVLRENQEIALEAVLGEKI
ncbi:trypsin-like peptidase domain-containing protein [Patescibacteria group bacterium]|nr:trypsin-like peptidase domain-containing protein [Patescibacteria group bacterium]